MIIPKKIKKGDTIGVIAPSNLIKEDDKEYIEKSTELMEKLGLKVVFGKYTESPTLGYSSRAKEKAQDINDMFKNEEIRAIFAVKGGENSNTTFEYLDFEAIRQNPKILCGFSDTTSLTNIITEKTGLITFSGPTFKSLTSWESDYSYKELIKRFIQGSLDLGESNEKYVKIKSGIAEGKLIGGNLSLTTKLTAGKYSINFKDKILFIEELGNESSPEMVSSNLSFMKQNGVFEDIKGIWVGNYEHESGYTLEQILLDTLEDKQYNFPIIKSNNFGHIDKKTIIPIGTKARINTEKLKVELIENCVE